MRKRIALVFLLVLVFGLFGVMSSGEGIRSVASGSRVGFVGNSSLFLSAKPIDKPKSVVMTGSTKKTAIKSDSCKSGRFIYYGSGYGKGLYRYDTKTGKKKKIWNSNKIRGFVVDINVYGKYIFFAVEQGSDPVTYEIVRIKKNGKDTKRMGYGKEMVVAGGYLYFIEQKKDEYGVYALDGNSVKMSINGGSKKTVLVNYGDWNNTKIYKYKKTVILKNGSNCYDSNGKRMNTKGISFVSSVYGRSSVSDGKNKYYLLLLI